MVKRVILSMHYANIHPAIIANQRAVLAALGYDIQQVLADKVPHGAWMDAQIAAAEPDTVFLFLDIDAFPLNAQVVERAF